ncbi:MAG: glycerate kinase, partial [Candidatus Caldatribacteriota bacterium]|nr:glycerate kinase [Candidatus Caldatribacteriota bacterium]
KGATEEMMVALEEALDHFARIIDEALDKDVKNIPGAGAAGGLGAGLMAFLDAKLKSGIKIIIEAVKLEEAVKDADFVITGEGKIDNQTIYGKVPVGVAKIAKKYHIPVMAIGAIIDQDAEIVHKYGVDFLVKVSEPPMSLTESKKNKFYLIRNCINQFFKKHMDEILHYKNTESIS